MAASAHVTIIFSPITLPLFHIDRDLILMANHVLWVKEGNAIQMNGGLYTFHDEM